jgi:hypothetical protein
MAQWHDNWHHVPCIIRAAGQQDAGYRSATNVLQGLTTVTRLSSASTRIAHAAVERDAPYSAARSLTEGTQ